MRLRLTLLLLCFALPAYATDTAWIDRDGVTQPLVLTPAALGAATAAQGDSADKALANARKGATITILPYGDTRQADYYCSATDCGVTFTAAFTAIKAAYTGAKIQVLDGVYPFTTTADGTDLDSVLIEGVNPVGMWSHYGTVFRQDADVKMFSLVHGAIDPKGVEFTRIHFKSDATKTQPIIYYKNSHNMGVTYCQFETTPQAIYAERAWDFWTLFNNFRDCGTGNTAATACVTAYNGAVDRASGWKFMGNRWESRPGTSFFSDTSGAGGANNNIMFVGNNKFEGTIGHGYPAIYGEMTQSLIEGNGFHHGDTGYPSVVLTGWGGNVVGGNYFQNQYSYAVESNNANLIIGNIFQNTIGTPTAHVHTLGSGNRVMDNHRAFNTIPVLQDDGTSTKAYHNDGAENNEITNLSDWPAAVSATEVSYLDGVTGAIQTQLNGKQASLTFTGNGTVTVSAPSGGSKTAGKQVTFDANGNIVASSYDVGAVGGGGSGTVSSGTTGQFAYYGSDGTAVAGRTLVAGDIPAIPESGVTNLAADLAAKVIAPATNTDGYMPVWSGANSKTLAAGFQIADTSINGTMAKRDASGNIAAAYFTAAFGTSSNIQIKDQSYLQALITKASPSGNASIIDIVSAPADGTSDAYYRFGRNTNTTGKHYMQVLKGNASSTANAQIGGNTDTYFAADNGKVGIGTSTPAAGTKLDVVGVARSTEFRDVVKANGTCSTSINIDPTLGGIHTLTLSGACAIGVTNLAAGQSFTLKLTQSSTTAPTFTSAYKWAGGAQPAWSTSATKYDKLACSCDDGTTLDCVGMVDLR